jgi:hypothetical protein
MGSLDGYYEGCFDGFCGIDDGRFFETEAGESLAGTLCALFRASGDDFAVALVANSEHCIFRYKDTDGGFWGYKWFMTVPPRLYVEYKKQESDEWRHDEDLDVIGRARHLGGPLFKDIREIIVQPKQLEDETWRKAAQDYLAGVGINNQGNVFRTNRRRIVFDDLYFRTLQEQYLYEAAVARGIAVLPLPVIVRADGLKRPDGSNRRMEPDLCFFHKGRFVVIEIDGSSHVESPVEADERLRFLRERGAIIHRIPASSCSDFEKAKLALSDALRSVELQISAR